MVSPARRREVVEQAQTTLAVSERRACEVMRQPRSTQRYVAKERDGERPLVQRMRELVRRHPRYGYRRVWALLRGEGLRVNRKRVYRLWRREGFKVPQKQRKRRRLGHSGNGCGRRCRGGLLHEMVGFALQASIFREFGAPRESRAQSPSPGGGEYGQNGLAKRDPHSRVRVKRL